MILQRLATSIRKQDWFTVLIETLIVVLGVFLGIQLGNWNADRETRERAAVFSERLTEDLRYEAWAYEYLLEYNKDVRRSARAALDSLYGEAPLSDEQFIVSVYRATQYKYHDRGRATYDELLSTGEIGLIWDETLRTTAISLFNTELLDVIAEEGRAAPVRTIFRRRVPAPVQAAALRQCGDRFVPSGDYEAIIGSLAYPCSLELPPGEIKVAADLLRADPELVEALQIRFADVETAITDLETVNAPMVDKLRVIAGRGT
ncbi:hypothetical protein WNY37_15975 [Henriciella sp. AS95]|uniref:hypothetical protein n=1 Tax=Henriciella sp. AS95 TaxID=3135782 RepID=UPI003178B2E3